MLEESPPIFILAPPRSFTSVTCAMLGNHPELYGMAETSLFVADTVWEMVFEMEARPSGLDGLLRCIAQLGFNKQNVENVRKARRWLDQRRTFSTWDIFDRLGIWAKGRQLIEKSPSHVFRRKSLNRIREHFPGAFYLHLTRHPQTMLQSLARMWDLEAPTDQAVGLMAWIGHDPRDFRDRVLDPDKAWLEPQLNIIDFLETVPEERQLRLRGEDLLSDPPHYLARICEWLSVRCDSEVMEAMLHPERSPYACFGPFNAKLGNDPNFLEHPELRPFSDVSVPLSEDEADGLAYSDKLRQSARALGY